MNSNFWTNFVMLLVIFHFIVGFAFLVYKLSPKKEDYKNQAKPNNDEK
jgi:flagellar biogenesis protein FliO